MVVTLANPHTLRDEETGLLLLCCKCNQYAIYWDSRQVPFCKEHMSIKWYMPRREEK